MSDRITVYTAVIGAGPYELLEPLCPCKHPIRFVCFTDRDDIRSAKWEIVRVPLWACPVRQARSYKLLPHLSIPEARDTMWIDSRFQLLKDPQDIVAEHGNPSALMFRHPDRTNIRDEVNEIWRLGKGEIQRLSSHMERMGGFPDCQTSLSATGLVYRDFSAATMSFSASWYQEFMAGNHTRDQLSVDYAAHCTGTRITHIARHYKDNPFAKWTKRG